MNSDAAHVSIVTNHQITLQIIAKGRKKWNTHREDDDKMRWRMQKEKKNKRRENNIHTHTNTFRIHDSRKNE